MQTVSGTKSFAVPEFFLTSPAAATDFVLSPRAGSTTSFFTREIDRFSLLSLARGATFFPFSQPQRTQLLHFTRIFSCVQKKMLRRGG